MLSPLKVPVEALSEQRWARLERSLFARHQSELLAANTEPTLTSQRRLPLYALLAGAALALVLAIVLVRGAFQGSETPLQSPSRIATGSVASHLALAGLSLDVRPESAVVVGAETSQGLLIVVDRGGIACEVAPRAAGAPLIVQAGAARVRVVGTRFTVSRNGESARVEVEHGVVEVSESGRTWRVGAGQTWFAPVTALPAVPTPELPLPTPEASAPPVSGNRGSSSRARSAAPYVRPDTAATRQGDNHPPPVTPPSQATFEDAARLEAREPGRAAALYQSLEGGHDFWAQNALYAHGRLEAARGNAAMGRRLLTQYLAAFPRGTNADDARAVVGRLK